MPQLMAKEESKRGDSQKNQSIADIFGLSSSHLKNPSSSHLYVPPNVRQQITLWEKELNSIQVDPGLLIEFENQNAFEKFLDFANRRKIRVLKQMKEKCIAVVELKNEREVYHFTETA